MRWSLQYSVMSLFYAVAPILIAVGLLVGDSAAAQSSVEAGRAATRPVGGTLGPLVVCRENPRYFATADGRVIYLTGSHTWAVRQERGFESVSSDFDYPAFLQFLADHHHNFLRLWAWEHAQWMQFVPADKAIRYAPLPWARTGPGMARDAKPKFDLSKFDEAYFKRLRERVEMADQKGIYVDVMFFQGFSVEQKQNKVKGVDPKIGNPWDGHPFHRDNNINGIDGDPNKTGQGLATHALAIPAVTHLQEAYVAHTIDALAGLENVVWEIGNECHTESVEWQYHMIRYVRNYEASKKQRHLIGMTGAPIELKELLASPADWISPHVNKLGYLKLSLADGKKVTVVDSDHGDPWRSDPTRPWRCLLLGYQFILMDPYMDVRIGEPKEPDPEYEAERQAMGAARRMAERMDLARTTPQPGLTTTGYCLAESGSEYLVYAPNGGRFELKLAKGTYQAQWIDPRTGNATEAGNVISEEAAHAFTSPGHGAVVLYLTSPR